MYNVYVYDKMIVGTYKTKVMIDMFLRLQDIRKNQKESTEGLEI